jgi:hypothetical protein
MLAACGRFGFDQHGPDGGLHGDGVGGDGGIAQPLIVPIVGHAGNGAIDIAFDAAGGFAVTGVFKGMLQLGSITKTETSAQGSEIYVAAFDANGTPRWAWSGGASVFASGQSVAWLPDGRVYAAGYFASTLANANNIDAGGGQDALQVWLTPTGALDNATHAGGGANVQTRGMAVSGSQITFGGIYSSTVDFGPGPLTTTGAGIDNAFLNAGDVANGVTQSKSFNGGNDVFINDVAIDAAGRVCIAGRFTATTDFGGGPIGPPGVSSGFVARFDAGLTYAWARELDYANMQAVGFATNGDCIASGYANGPFMIDGLSVPNAGGNDGFVIRFAEADGHAQWIQTVASAGADSVYSLVPYDLDRVAIAGFFTGSAMVAGVPEVSDGTADGFVIGLDKDGTVLWRQPLAGSGAVEDSLSGMNVDLAHRELGLAGEFIGDLQVGTAMQTATEDTGFALVLPLPP